MSKAEILKIVKVIACVIGFGCVGVITGLFVAVAVSNWNQVLLSVLAVIFGILGVALGGFIGNKIIRSKFK